MWSQWDTLPSNNHSTNSSSDASQATEVVPSVCPLTLSAGRGLRAGIVAHFNGSENFA